MPSPFSDSSSIISTTSSSSSSTASSAFSFDDTELKYGGYNIKNNNAVTSSVLSKLAVTVRDTRTKVEQKKLELNASMQERLPEWRSRGVMYGNRARETSMEWSRKGKEAVDRWKKDRKDRINELPSTEETAHTVFGQPLENAVLFTKLTEHDHIPGVLRRSINYLDEHGIQEVGIYRIPGSTLAVNKIRSTFDSGYDNDFFCTLPDPNVVATLLKMYLRELPEPIIPQDLAQEYKQQITQFIRQQQLANSSLDIGDDHTTTEIFDTSKTESLPSITPKLLDTIRITTIKLPAINLYLLKVLCQHLKRIADNAEENKMTTSNLALIFMPTLGIGKLLFHCMVDYYDKSFGVPDMDSQSTLPLLITSAGPISSSNILNKPLPPPLPHKPKHISIPKPPRRQNKSLDLGRIQHQHIRGEHSKTLSDTDVKSMITPPRKPPRSPIAKPALECFRPTIDRLAETKPRSSTDASSLSSNAFIGSRGGSRVEAIGRQFEQIMTKAPVSKH